MSWIAGSGNLIMPSIQVSASGEALTTIQGTGEITLPSIGVSGTGKEFLSGTGEITLPSVVVRGKLDYSPVCPFEDVSHMPNDYFQFHDNDTYDNDRSLYEDLLMEANNIHGTPMMYYVVTYDTNYDPLFGEDSDRRIERKFPIKGVFQLPEELEQYAQVGIEGLDSFPIYVSKKHFSYFSKYDNEATIFPSPYPEDINVHTEYTPKAGDIIKSEYNNLYYEIVDVGEEEEMFLQRKHSWIFTVRTFRNEHLSLSATTSAAMSDISDVISREDILAHNDYISSAETDVLYDPEDTEDDSEDGTLDGW